LYFQYQSIFLLKAERPKPHAKDVGAESPPHAKGSMGITARIPYDDVN